MLTLSNLFRRLIEIQSFALTAALSSGDSGSKGSIQHKLEREQECSFSLAVQ